jgi:hypothetical protein
MTQRRWWFLALGLTLLLLVPVEPWTLFMNVHVQESPPQAAEMLRRGQFVSLEHTSSGNAQILETADGRRWLRLDPFSTSLGPDLVVTLSAKAPGGWFGYDADHIVLGPMKGNRGAQNYELPRGLDLNRFASAVIWCQRFHVGFAAAALAPVSSLSWCDVDAPEHCGG